MSTPADGHAVPKGGIGVREYFCGWYFKCQNGRQTLAVIPAEHGVGRERSGSVQLITDAGAWFVPYPGQAMRRDGEEILIGENRFGRNGLRLDLQAPGLCAQGELRFGALTPLRYDIMGPFCCVPFMECRHSVVSMRHAVHGKVRVNGEEYGFDGGVGYIEGDHGRAFPRRYVWTQYALPGGSLMLAVAEIPLGGVRFTGVIGAVLWRGREYRLATYLGARVERIGQGEVVVRQRGLRLTARLLEPAGQPLRAPDAGQMQRTIHEHAACSARYLFQQGGDTLFDHEAPDASFEYEYPW